MADADTATTDHTVTLQVLPSGTEVPRHEVAGVTCSFSTLNDALQHARSLRRDGTKPAVRIVLRGGRHELPAPVLIGSTDGGIAAVRRKWLVQPARPLVIEAAPGETPVISGGRKIEGFQELQSEGRRTFVASVSGVKEGDWYFTQLFVNGERRARPRLPREGLFHVDRLLDAPDPDRAWKPGVDRFIYRDGDLKSWHNLEDVELVALHNWMESRVRLRSIEPQTRLATLDRQTCMRMVNTHLDQQPGPYYVENVFEAMQPGEWYLDRVAGLLHYWPREDESIEGLEVIAPVLTELMRLEGERDGEPIDAVHLRGLTFAHAAEVVLQAESAFGQASHRLPGAIRLINAHHCSITECRFTHLGGYAVELMAGCRDVKVKANAIVSIGGGGVKVWHGETDAGTAVGQAPLACERITIADNTIAHCGQIYHSAVGVLIGKCSAIQVLHNHIHHLYYTGISVGWTWGYAAGNNAYGNVIEHNHIHNLGQGLLSDMGGIYTLGISTGTRIRCNVIHDVYSSGYGGWGIYPDEGSSDLLIETNLVYSTTSGGFHQHYGQNNVVRNNIFAFGRDAQIQQTRGEDHLTLIFEQNIVYGDGGALIAGNEGAFMGGNWSSRNIRFTRNLYFDRSDPILRFADHTFEQWQAMGLDADSIIADPGFKAPAEGDFRLEDWSPALRIGFKPWCLSNVGPRKHGDD